MATISPSLLLRELAGSIELSDSEEGEYGYDGAFDDDDDDNNVANSTTNNDDAEMEAQLDLLLGAESRSDNRKKWEKQKKLRRSERPGDQDDEAVAHAVRQRLKALPSTTCTICFEDESDDSRFVRLNCNHRFCSDCLRAFTGNEIQDVARVLHKLAVLRQLASNDWTIEFGWTPTIRCPAAQCGGLIDVECMQQYATPDQIAVFQRFAAARRAQIDAAAELVSEIARRNADILEKAKSAHRDSTGRLFVRSDGIMHCARCGEWAVEPAARGRLRCTACLQPYCSTCTMSHLRRYACDFTPKCPISVAAAEKHFIKMITAHPDGRKYRMCPRCDALIEKNLGCDHHVCRACSLVYNWSSSPIPTLQNAAKWCKEVFFASAEFEVSKKKNKK
jgi:hypothetical protein